MPETPNICNDPAVEFASGRRIPPYSDIGQALVESHQYHLPDSTSGMICGIPGGSISIGITVGIGIVAALGKVIVGIADRTAGRTPVAGVAASVTKFITVTVPPSAGGTGGSGRVTDQITDQDADRGPDHDAGHGVLSQHRLNRGKTLAALPTNLIGGTPGGIPHLPSGLTPLLVDL
jgi:hypothetical protein